MIRGGLEVMSCEVSGWENFGGIFLEILKFSLIHMSDMCHGHEGWRKLALLAFRNGQLYQTLFIFFPIFIKWTFYYKVGH